MKISNIIIASMIVLSASCSGSESNDHGHNHDNEEHNHGDGEHHHQEEFTISIDSIDVGEPSLPANEDGSEHHNP